jgi:hypothetical protein
MRAVPERESHGAQPRKSPAGASAPRRARPEKTLPASRANIGLEVKAKGRALLSAELRSASS